VVDRGRCGSQRERPPDGLLFKGREAEAAGPWPRIRQCAEGVRPGQSDYRRVRLALLLSLPGTTFRDDAAALALLQGWVKDKRNENSSLRPLASIILSHLQELRRVDDALQSQSSRLRDEQRRADALQQKLEALLEMEMRMIEREQAIQPRKR
jgi:hypothetical protein